MPKKGYPKTYSEVAQEEKPITLRPALPADYADLTAMHAEGFPHYWNIEAFNNFFSVPGTVGFIAESHKEMLGMVVCRVQHEQVDIITLVVRQNARSQGIGRKLMQKALDFSASQGATSMFLDVEENNLHAINLYKTAGFVQIHCRKLYYRQQDGSYTDALVMKRDLS